VTVAFAAACLVVFLGLSAWVLGTSWQEAQSRTETIAKASAQTVSANISLLFQTSFQALRRIDDAVGDSLLSPPPSAILDLNAAVSDLPVNVQAWVFDAQGNPRMTNATTTQSVNVADREYFKELAEGQQRAVSPLVVSRSSGTKVFAIGRRLERDKRFAGIAIIVVPAEYMDTFRVPLNLGPQSTVGLIRDDGMLVTRSPVPDEATDMSGYVLFTDYLTKADNGTYVATSPTDGIQRLVAYMRVPGLPLVAVASVALSEAYAPFWQAATLLAALAIPGLLCLSWFTWWTIRSQNALSGALEANQLLFKEIHHRVKNNLQQVMALVGLASVAPPVREELARKIQAMVAVHEHMYRSDRYQTLDASGFIPSLVSALQGSFRGDLTISADIAPALLNREQGLPLALIIAEVVGNAAKHAFPDGRAGLIAVSLGRAGETKAVLTIRDNGVGYDPDRKTSGTGSKLVAALCRQLQAVPRVAGEGGTVFELTFDVAGFSGSGSPDKATNFPVAG
jgi:two-component sensor histidine kinase